ncbi:MAG: aromatic ring-hydroxylating dioxygenase subunit alpha [Acidimicrobiales bacterium]|nr:aromatic ring-hydroxylating dioxygenase subunit alpha [Acidimicrobiales bacterium]
MTLRVHAAADLGDADLSVDRYLSREFHDLEVERLWGRAWQLACREEDIPEVGDTTIYDIADRSLLIVREAPERIRAYHNACLHRGRQLRSEPGWNAELRCPFHGFTWRLDGSLKEIPCDWDFPHVDPAAFALPEALVATWGGWVFINMDPAAAPFEDFMGTFAEHFPWRQEDLTKGVHVAKVLRANWKVALEAFIESYHVIATHPQLLVSLGDANTQYDVFDEQPRWNRMITAMGTPSPHLPYEVSEQDIMDDLMEQFMGPGVTFPLAEGKTAREMMGDLIRGQVGGVTGEPCEVSDSEAFDAIEYYLFPNFVPWGGYSRINYRFRPYGNDPDMCIMDVMLLAPFNKAEGRPPAPPVHWLGPDDEWTDAPELGLLAKVFVQDTFNIPRVQRGLKATVKPGVTLAHYQESRIRHYHQELDRWLQVELAPSTNGHSG